MTTKTRTADDADFAPTSWSARIQAGLVSGLIITVFAISFGSLVVGSTMPEALATMIGMALIGTATLCFVLGFFSRIPGLVPMVQDVPSAALGVMVAGTITTQAAAGGVTTPAQIVLLCVSATLVLALSTLLFGTLRLATVMRYTPRPVLAGFLAGTGYFIVLGALGLCLGDTVSLSSLGDLVAPEARDKVAVAVAVAVALTAGSRVLSPNFALGAVLLLAIVAFHACRLWLGADMTAISDAGWIATLPEGGLSWPPLHPGDLKLADLTIVAQHILPMVTMVLLSTAALLMYSAALSTESRVDIDLDGELRALGAANLVSGLVGGLPGFHGVSSTMTAYRIARGHRMISFVAGGFVLLIYLQGNAVLEWLPLPILAGFMLWVGFDFMVDWLVVEARATPRGEAWLTLSIFAAIAGFGLFQGTLFGLAAGGVLFIVNYSRLDPVRGQFSADVYHGASELTPDQVDLLERHGRAIVVLKLQGYIFFGTAFRVRDRIRALTRSQDTRFLLLDLEAVTGIDATAAEHFKRISADLQVGIEHVTVTGMSPAVARIFARTGLQTGEGAHFAAAPDLNAGLDSYVDRLLAEHGSDAKSRDIDIRAILTDILSDAAMAQELLTYLQPVDAATDDTVIRQGDSAADIYFLEKGHVDVLVGDTGAERRVRRLGPGSILGEISYFGGGVRTTTIRAVGPVRLWRLSTQEAAQVLAQAPDLSSRFYQGIARTLARRVEANTRLIRMLQA